MSTILNGPYDGADFVDKFDTFLFDCDGVIWQGNDLIPGVARVFDVLKGQGKRIIFVTNNSTKSRTSYLTKFKSLGIETSLDNIFGSSYCSAFYISNTLNFPKDKKVYVFGMKGVCDELDSFGIKWTGASEDNENLKDMADISKMEYDPDVAAVLVGFDLDLNYKKLAKAYTYLQSKETLFLATNDDLTLPTGGTTFPGTGSVLNVISSSTGRAPVVLGKPHQTMLDCIVDRWHLDRNRTCMIGDRLDTDIEFGKLGGLQTLLVLTGVTRLTDLAASDINPDFIIDSLGCLV